MAAIVDIKLEQLKIHPKNVRKEYDGIEELAQSIKLNDPPRMVYRSTEKENNDHEKENMQD